MRQRETVSRLRKFGTCSTRPGANPGGTPPISGAVGVVLCSFFGGGRGVGRMTLPPCKGNIRGRIGGMYRRRVLGYWGPMVCGNAAGGADKVIAVDEQVMRNSRKSVRTASSYKIRSIPPLSRAEEKTG
eukprot:759547-Hanusia_phi.AAC.4